MVGDITSANVKVMRNTGLREGELLGLLNNDIDLENKTMTIRQAVKLVDQRDGTKCADGSIKTLNIKAVADILGHTTTEITERNCVKKDNSRLTEIKDGFEIKRIQNLIYRKQRKT